MIQYLPGEVSSKQDKEACQENGLRNDPQAAQVNLLREQRTDFQPSKVNCKQHSHKPRSKGHKRYSNEHKNEGPPYKKDLIQTICIIEEIYVTSVEILSIHKGSSVLQESTGAGIAINMVTSVACATGRENLLNLVHPKHISCKQVKYTCKTILYVACWVI